MTTMGLEPITPRSEGGCAIQLRHAAILYRRCVLYNNKSVFKVANLYGQHVLPPSQGRTSDISYLHTHLYD
jgi:hypothetical protein